MPDAGWSLLILVGVVGLLLEAACRRMFPRGIRQGVRDRRMIRRAEKTIRDAERITKEAKR